MRRRVTVPAVLGALLSACAVGLAAPQAAATDTLAADTLGTDTLPARAAAWKTGGCDLCHEVPGMPVASRQDSCADCHAWVRDVAASPAKRAKAMEIFPLWERYERSVASYMAVPSLAAGMARLEPAWIDSWLQDPHDVRPGMAEGMPRFALDQAQRAEIVAAFADATVTVAPSPSPDLERVPDGARLFSQRGCAACHSLGRHHAEVVLPTAPDLAHTRDRMSPDRVWAWISDPAGVSAAATMPALGLAADEVTALRDYVLLIDASAPPAEATTELPAPAAQPVTWAMVEAEVFGKICVHCHMDPAQNGGRRGPGNAGGFGWAATDIELQTYEGVVAVADRIPAALARRRQEAGRDTVPSGSSPAVLTRPARPGMPLGLPPLSDEQTALVLGWIEQGMPR